MNQMAFVDLSQSLNRMVHATFASKAVYSIDLHSTLSIHQQPLPVVVVASDTSCCVATGCADYPSANATVEHNTPQMAAWSLGFIVHSMYPLLLLHYHV